MTKSFLIFFVAAMSLLLFCPVPVLADAQPQVEGTATKVVGKVSVVRNEKTMSLSGGDKIYAGDLIKVAKDSSLLITLPDKSTALLGPNTATRVQKSRLETFSLTLLEGSILHQVTKRSERGAYQVHTPSATVGVRGTRFLTTVSKDGSTRTSCQEGSVDVGKGEDEEGLLLSEGERGEAQLNKEPEQTEGLSSEDALSLTSDVIWAARSDADLATRSSVVMTSVNAVVTKEDERQRELNDRFMDLGLRLAAFIRDNSSQDGLSNASEGLDLFIEGLKIYRDLQASQERTDAAYYLGVSLRDNYHAEGFRDVDLRYQESLKARRSRSADMEGIVTNLERLSTLLKVAQSPILDTVKEGGGGLLKKVPSFGLW